MEALRHPAPVEDMVSKVEHAAHVDEAKALQWISTLAESAAVTTTGQGIDLWIAGRIAEIDRSLSLQLREVLHHPDFQTLESVWRSLRYLVNQSELSGQLKLRVCNISKSDLAQDIIKAEDPARSALFRNVEGEFDQFGGEPFGVLVGAYEFDRSPQDVELLQSISAIAAATHAPFLAAASPGMFGWKSFSELAIPRNIGKLFEGPDAASWRSFRESEDARYVALTLPRMLLRLPYSSRTMPIEEFDFEEGVDASDASTFLWGSAAFALAARISNAFSMNEWCAAIRGVDGGGLVEGLPNYTFATDDGDLAFKCPAEIAISDRTESELARVGFIPLVHVRSTDSAAFFSVSSVQRPREFSTVEASTAARLSIQLPYVFAVSRFAHFLKCLVRDKIGSFMSRGDLESFLNRWISSYALLDDTASLDVKAKYPLSEARIDINEVDGRPGAYLCVAFLRPHFQLEDLPISLRVVISLPAPVSRA